MEENKFGEEWRKAVAGAEAEPSGSVWSVVESELIALENRNIKRQAIFYQRLAASLLLFAFLAGAIGFYYGKVTDDRRQVTLPSNQARQKESAIHRVEPGEKEKSVPSLNSGHQPAALNLHADKKKNLTQSAADPGTKQSLSST